MCWHTVYQGRKRALSEYAHAHVRFICMRMHVRVLSHACDRTKSPQACSYPRNVVQQSCCQLYPQNGVLCACSCTCTLIPYAWYIRANVHAFEHAWYIYTRTHSATDVHKAPPMIMVITAAILCTIASFYIHTYIHMDAYIHTYAHINVCRTTGY